MTLSNSEAKVGTSEFGLLDAPAEREIADQGTPDTPNSEVTHSDALRRWLRVAGGYITPPSVLAARPASVTELRAYARRGSWTTRSEGPLRAAGVAWWRMVGLPATVTCRYVEWIAQRPGRSLIVFALWKVFMFSHAGMWFARYVVSPVGEFLAWILL